MSEETGIMIKDRIEYWQNKYFEEKEKNKKAIEMLQEHIKHCEQEANGSLHNEICHISLEFDKSLLDITKQVEGE